MNHTQAENIILRAVHDAGGVVNPAEALAEVSKYDQWGDPLGPLERGEFDSLFAHLVKLEHIVLDPEGDPQSTRYYRLGKLGYERLELPGSEAKMRRETELRNLMDHKKWGIKYLGRNQVIAEVAAGLGEIARAIGYAAVRMRESVDRLAAACDERNETIRENTAAINRTGKEARENTRDIVAAIMGSQSKYDRAESLVGERGSENIQPTKGVSNDG